MGLYEYGMPRDGGHKIACLQTLQGTSNLPISDVYITEGSSSLWGHHIFSGESYAKR